MKISFRVVLTPLLVCLAQGVIAQNAHFEDVPVPASFPPAEGRFVGSLKLDADVMAGVMTTNNVYRDASSLSSEASQLELSSTLAKRGQRYVILGTLEYYTQEFRDDAYQDMNLDAVTATMFTRFATSKISNLRLLLVNEEDILGKEQSDQLNSFNNGLRQIQRVEAIFEVDNSRYFTNIMARNDKVDSQSSSENQGDNLNRSERDYILLGGRYFDWGKAFLFGGTQAITYESSTMPLLAQRNSNEKRYGVGAEYEVGKFSGDVDIFQFTQRFRSATIPDIKDEWVGSAKLNYLASDRLTLVFAIDRQFHETNIRNFGGIFEENTFVGGAWAFSPNLYLRMGPSYNKTELKGTPLVIDRVELDVELVWQVSDHFDILFTGNVFNQKTKNALLSDFNAQQTNSLLRMRYSL